MIPRNRKSCKLDFTQEVVWERIYLKKKCKEVGVEKEYILYEKRLRCNSIGVFIFLHSAVTLIHCFLLIMTCQYLSIIQIDIGFYIGAALLIITVLSINFKEEIIRKHSWIMYASSVVAASLMVSVDLILHVYHKSTDNWDVGSFYDTYVIYSIYLFMPIPFIKGPLILGVFVSLSYITYFFAYLDSKHLYHMNNVVQFNQMVVDVLHYICFNMLGLFFRLMNDIIVRSSFLDRQQYVMEEIWLRSARKQEQRLLHSILPPQIARPFQEDIRSRVALAGKRRGHRSHNIKERIMAIQNHPEVSILYADVVNYTYLTTTLTVNELVTLLHDLYGRFDVAAAHFKVQRIKFLGDCYYCVAGLSRPNPDHAKCCIDLGHCMIAHIREVRSNRHLNIDMRIGVNSGSLLAGVIGAAKLQYDIWGNDVMIAGKLESTGRPGHIHISERTLGSILDNTYEILPGTEEAVNDPYLSSHNIHTFLIAAIDIKLEDYDLKGDDANSFKHLAAERTSTIERELQDEYAKLPVGTFNIRDFIRFWKKTKNKPHNMDNASRPIVDFFFLHFRDPRLEYNYMRQPDYMLKYSILLAWFVGISLIYIQLVYHDSGNLCYYVNIIVFTTMTVPLFITWFKKMCYWRYKKDSHNFSKWACTIFRIAEFMQGNLISRLCIYMSTIIGYFGVISVVLVDCDQEEFQVRHIEDKLYHYEPDLFMCFHPWVLTNMACLMIGMSVIFTRIPWMVKIIVSVLEGLTYVIIMFFQFEYVIHHSKTTNPYFLSEYAHSYIIAITIVSFYLMERQAEFNSKVNYNWRVELLKKQQDAVITNKSITILLQNILPAHVVSVYLTSIARHELYYEDYQMVAVMFASLQNFVLDLANLRVLNEIITEFDKILYYYRKDYLVEKIKIVGCTYMAACGLDPRFSGHIDGHNNNSIIKEVARAQRFLAAFQNQSNVEGVRNEVVFILTTFALDLLRTLWMCSSVYNKLPIDRGVFSADMSIGISCGEVMAGVVGASQVHYDIWGNPVNMASRMDSTGVSGHIHITQETAVILRGYGIECNYRGMTFVKGRGVLPTYFVGIDEDYEFRNTPEFYNRPTVNIVTRKRQDNDDIDDIDR